MKIGGGFDLTYCSNIHAGEHWAEVSSALQRSLPRVRELVGASGPFGIGLRLSATAACELEQASALARFREFLAEGNYYVPTINGFPYGAFHGTRVKERVYQPDWRSPDRLDYTNRLARLLATFAHDRGERAASISTVPGAFRTEVAGESDAAAIAAGMLRHAAYLVRLAEDTGVRVALAIEPEPACFIDSVGDAIRFFREYLFEPSFIRKVAAESGLSLTSDDVVRHVGVCLDTCHMAVGFEDGAAALSHLAAEGICVYKMQLSSALSCSEHSNGRSARALLQPFAEDTYLHQVVISDGAGLRRYTDLPQALDGARDLPADAEWRVHFHVPIFLDAMSGFLTTQPYLRSMLDLVTRTSVTSCLEVETYTWDVLPPEYRSTDVCAAIARELSWVRAVTGL